MRNERAQLWQDPSVNNHRALLRLETGSRQRKKTMLHRKETRLPCVFYFALRSRGARQLMKITVMRVLGEEKQRHDNSQYELIRLEGMA